MDKQGVHTQLGEDIGDQLSVEFQLRDSLCSTVLAKLDAPTTEHVYEQLYFPLRDRIRDSLHLYLSGPLMEQTQEVSDG